MNYSKKGMLFWASYSVVIIKMFVDCKHAALIWRVLCLGAAVGDSDAKLCEHHPGHVQKYYCDDCSVSICDVCVEDSGCKLHHRSPVAAVAERLRQDIDTSFTGASMLIGQKKAELESRLRALSDEKDRALLRIDAAFEGHVHTLSRRATLLKNKVIDVYNENSNGLEAGLEEVDTAMTCVVSLREYHESSVDRGDFDSVLVGHGTAEISEVARNIAERVQPPEIHIVFDGDHGIEKFRTCSKDLGRVVCNRSAPRPPDITPNDVSPSLGPGESGIPGPDQLQVESRMLAGGSRELYDRLDNINLTQDGMADQFAGVGQTYVGVEASEAVSTLTGDGDAALHGGGDTSLAAGMPPQKMTWPSCMVTNNNYFSPLGCKFAAAGVGTVVSSASSQCRSYDEHGLRRELGVGGETEAFCMSRSDYWPLGTCSETALNDNVEPGNVIVELSGEQTSL